jgi:hypothetical protein
MASGFEFLTPKDLREKPFVKLNENGPSSVIGRKAFSFQINRHLKRN